MARMKERTMRTKLETPPVSITQTGPRIFLWPLVVALTALCLAVGALIVFQPSDEAVRDTTSATAVTEDQPTVSEPDSSLVQGGLHPAPFSPVIPGDGTAAVPGGIDHSPQQR
jgi:hypothetical protein